MMQQNANTFSHLNGSCCIERALSTLQMKNGFLILLLIPLLLYSAQELAL